MPTWISLLRAVNLGARNQVSMPVLRGHLAEAGFADVRTYVQSGNIITTSGHRSESAVAKAMKAVIAEHFDLEVPVIVRNPADIAAVLALDPFPDAAREQPKLVAVVFFDQLIAATTAEDFITHAEQVGERAHIDGRELYIAYTQGGVHTSRLTPDVLRRKLGQDGTARNWRTVTALGEMTG